ncbi:MAG: hypothetical protein GYB65_02875 [Chloroflexi bacterium]|nr:hypothetical protein [Chloroflexota bacterium]
MSDLTLTLIAFGGILGLFGLVTVWMIRSGSGYATTRTVKFVAMLRETGIDLQATDKPHLFQATVRNRALTVCFWEDHADADLTIRLDAAVRNPKGYQFAVLPSNPLAKMISGLTVPATKTTSGDAQFDRQVTVASTPPDLAARILQPRLKLRGRLMATRQRALSVNQEHVVLYPNVQDERTIAPDDWKRWVMIVLEVAQAIEDQSG